MKVIKKLEGVCLADHGFKKPNASSRSFLELTVVGDPSPPRSSMGILLGPGTDWDLLDSDSNLPARSLPGRQPSFYCSAPQQLGENTGDAERGVCPLFSRLALPPPLQDMGLKPTPCEMEVWAENRSQLPSPF